ncbi:MAG: zinc ribbon domain-containing protein, partial [Clostridiales bacterium]|nr:zinc ribbon domain-containing protein [Clostridiales bacterium]
MYCKNCGKIVDEDSLYCNNCGTRLETDMIYADRLNAGQKIKLTAFKYVEEEKIEQFKNATFKV